MLRNYLVSYKAVHGAAHWRISSRSLNHLVFAMATNTIPSPERAINFLNVVEKLKVNSHSYNQTQHLFTHMFLVPDFTWSLPVLLQTTPRTGWVKRGVNKPESIADHMYRMSVMALLVQGTSYDYTHCIKLTIVHDIAESQFFVYFFILIHLTIE